jgi:DNA-binding SARP family transcriptional activator
VERAQNVREEGKSNQFQVFYAILLKIASQKEGDRMATHLALMLLGPFQATLDARPVDGLNSGHLQALLAYLAVERHREHTREQVALLLWSERTDQDALSALRFALSNLRHILGDRQQPCPFLLVTRNSLQFNPLSDHKLDVVEFQKLSNQTDLASLEQAATLYRGPFLDHLSLGDSPFFEEWMLSKGEEIRRNALFVLTRLTALQIKRGEAGEATRWARRQLQIEPFREQAHRQLIEALALGGERAAALEHYESFQRLLNQELGCEPEDETQALFSQIRNGMLPKPQQAPVLLSSSTQSGLTETGYGTAFHFVAREQEMNRLNGSLEQALMGQGGMTLITGEVGCGKTALLDEINRQSLLKYANLVVLRGRCNAHGGAGDPYLPFREMLQTLAGDIESKRAGGNMTPEQTRRVWEILPAVGAALVEHGPDLIGSFVPGEALLHRIESFLPPAGGKRWLKQLKEAVVRSQADGSVQQLDLFDQVTEVLSKLSEHIPLLLMIDDLQWADTGTSALLFHLGRRLAVSRILLVCAYRPQVQENDLGNQPAGLETDQATNFHPTSGIDTVLRELIREWGDIMLNLDQADGRVFVDAYVDSEPNQLDATFRQTLFTRTNGNPLFTVELLRCFERKGMLLKDKVGNWIQGANLDWNYCPPQVESVIAWHLAILPEQDRKILQVAAVQGEQFIAEVAARVLGKDEQEVIQRLSGALRTQHRLIEAVSLERLISSGQRLSHYHFRHALAQNCAYSSLDTVERARLHEATGQTLEMIYASEQDKPLTLATTLARHFEAGGLYQKAARAFYDSGRQAIHLSAYREALIMFDHGLSSIAKVPISPEAKEIKLMLEVARFGPLRNLTGLGNLDLADAIQRAMKAGAEETEGRSRLLMLQAETEQLVAKGLFEATLAIAEQILDLATEWGDEVFVAIAHWRIGFVYNLMAKFQEAEKQFNWILSWQTPQREAEVREVMSSGLTSIALTFSALDQWWLGNPMQALKRSEQAVRIAVERGDLFGQASVLAVGSTVLFLLRHDHTSLRERSEMCLSLCQQQGFSMWQLYAEVFLGWLMLMNGERVAGIERMQNALNGWKAIGMELGLPSLVMVLADGCLTAARQKQSDEDAERNSFLITGLAWVDNLLRPDAGGQCYLAELYRLRGELLLERDGMEMAGEALDCFQQSMQIGKEMEALGWQLRTAMSLVRLMERKAQMKELGEARVILRDVYARFSEGFDFCDLQDASTLIGKTPLPIDQTN